MALADIPVAEVEAWRARAGRSFAEFAESRVAVGALAVVALLAALALLAPWVAPQNPFDLSQLSIMDNKLPPLSRGVDGQLYLLGTDDQGRDMLSAIIFGLRLSLFVGITATAVALVIGTALGVLAAYLGGWIDAALM